MTKYEKLIAEFSEELIIKEKHFKSDAKGLCKGNKIGLSKTLQTSSEKSCVLAEEIGHYCTTSGNILSQSEIINNKQEKRARNWAYEKLIPLKSLTNAYELGIRCKYELSLYLEVTENFIDETLAHYKEKYGLYVKTRDYIIMFEPFSITKRIGGEYDGQKNKFKNQW